MGPSFGADIFHYHGPPGCRGYRPPPYFEGHLDDDCGMLLFFYGAAAPFPSGVAFFSLVLLLIMLMVCIFFWRNWVKSDRGSPRFVRYYLISAWVCWIVFTLLLLLLLSIFAMMGGTV